jgi:hypothetical protein
MLLIKAIVRIQGIMWLAAHSGAVISLAALICHRIAGLPVWADQQESAMVGPSSLHTWEVGIELAYFVVFCLLSFSASSAISLGLSSASMLSTMLDRLGSLLGPELSADAAAASASPSLAEPGAG